MTARRTSRVSRRVLDDDGAIIPERVGAFEGAPTIELARKKPVETRTIDQHLGRPGVRIRDTLATLVKQGYTDAAGEDAGKRYRDLREIAMGVRSGDNGGVRAPHWLAGGPTIAMIDAESELRAVKAALPVTTWSLLDMLCHENRSLRTMAYALGMSVEACGEACRAALKALAEFWAAGPKNSRKK